MEGQDDPFLSYRWSVWLPVGWRPWLARALVPRTNGCCWCLQLLLRYLWPGCVSKACRWCPVLPAGLLVLSRRLLACCAGCNCSGPRERDMHVLSSFSLGWCLAQTWALYTSKPQWTMSGSACCPCVLHMLCVYGVLTGEGGAVCTQ